MYRLKSHLQKGMERMADTVYRVVFDTTKMPSDTELQRKDEVVPKSTQQKETNEIKDKSLVDTKIMAKIATAYNVTSTILSYGARSESVGHELKGDFVMARKTQNNFATAREVTNIGFMLGAGFVVGGPAGAIAVGVNLGISYGMRALSVGLENRKLIDQIQTQKYLGSIEQERFIRNATTEMIR